MAGRGRLVSVRVVGLGAVSSLDCASASGLPVRRARLLRGRMVLVRGLILAAKAAKATSETAATSETTSEATAEAASEA